MILQPKSCICIKWEYCKCSLNFMVLKFVNFYATSTQASCEQKLVLLIEKHVEASSVHS